MFKDRDIQNVKPFDANLWFVILEYVNKIGLK